MKFRIIITAGIITLALAWTGLPVAQAEPDSSAAAPDRRTHVLNHKQTKRAHIGANIGKANNHPWLDYKLAKRKFGPHTKWRRYFAAGWMLSGQKVFKMTKHERRIVNRIRNKIRRNATLANPDQAQRTARACTGQTRAVFKNSWRLRYHHWLNSCATNRAILYFAATGAYIALIVQWSKTRQGRFIFGAIATATEVTSGSIYAAKRNSPKNAVVMRFNYSHIPVGVRVWYTVAPQR